MMKKRGFTKKGVTESHMQLQFHPVGVSVGVLTLTGIM